MNPFGHIYCAGRSDVGLRRKNNEDSFGLFPKLGVWLVADGMGGGDDGEIAAAAVVREVEELSARVAEMPRAYAGEDVARAVEGAMNRASAWIFNRTREKHLATCGSTVVGFIVDPVKPGKAIAFHAGDSRLYRLRGHTLKQITVDHSAAELIGAKSEADVNPIFRGMVLRAVGIKPTVDVERTPFDIRKGDYVLVCSDGLTRMVDDKRICEILRARRDPAQAVHDLVDAANAAGGVDNVTVVLAEVGTLPHALPRVDFPLSEEAETGTGAAAGQPASGIETAATRASVDAIGEEPSDAEIGDPVEPPSAPRPVPKPQPAPRPAPKREAPPTVRHEPPSAPKPSARPAAKPSVKSVVKTSGRPEPKTKPALMSVPKGAWREISLSAAILLLASCAVLVFMTRGRPGGAALPPSKPNEPMRVVAATSSPREQIVPPSEQILPPVAPVTNAVAETPAAPVETPPVPAVVPPALPVGARVPAAVAKTAPKSTADAVEKLRVRVPSTAGCAELAKACEKATFEAFARGVRSHIVDEERLLGFSEQLRRARRSADDVVRRPTEEAADRFLVDFKYALCAVPEVRKTLAGRPALETAWDLVAQGTGEAGATRLAAALVIVGMTDRQMRAAATSSAVAEAEASFVQSCSAGGFVPRRGLSGRVDAKGLSTGCYRLACACEKAVLEAFAKCLRKRLPEGRLFDFSEQLRRAQKSASSLVRKPSEEAAGRFLVDFKYVLLAVPEARKALEGKPTLAAAWDLLVRSAGESEPARLAAALLISALPEALP